MIQFCASTSSGTGVLNSDVKSRVVDHHAQMWHEEDRMVRWMHHIFTDVRGRWTDVYSC